MPPLLIPADNPGPYTGDGNNTWFLDGEVPTLVDAGVGQPSHVAAIERVLDGRPLAQLLVTHGHSDHFLGVPVLRARWPDLVVRKLVRPEDVDMRDLADGIVVRAGSSDLVALHTPGHAADHVCFWDRGRRELFGGDMALAETSVLIPAGRGGDLGAYLRSLDRLASLNLRTIYPGHGPVIENPSEVIAKYIEHRLRREREVLAAVEDGLRTPEEIARRLYPAIREDLRRAAELTVTAHLDKLRDEGRL